MRPCDAWPCPLAEDRRIEVWGLVFVVEILQLDPSEGICQFVEGDDFLLV